MRMLEKPAKLLWGVLAAPQCWQRYVRSLEDVILDLKTLYTGVLILDDTCRAAPKGLRDNIELLSFEFAMPA